MGKASLEDLFEEAFEAGIACVLGDGVEDAEADCEFERRRWRLQWHQILRPMIENSAARRLLQKDVLGRAIIGTLIGKPPPETPTSSGALRPSTAA